MRAGLWAWLREQLGIGLDEDAAADQALELGADVLGVLGHDRQVQGDAQVAGSQGAAEVGEGGKDLLVGGVVRYRWRRPGRLRCGAGRRLARRGEISVLRVTCRPLIASLSSRSLAVSSSIRAWPASRVRVSSRASILSSMNLPGSAVVTPAATMGADVPVNCWAITSVIAQYTRDAELDSSPLSARFHTGVWPRLHNS